MVVPLYELGAFTDPSELIITGISIGIAIITIGSLAGFVISKIIKLATGR